MRGPVITAQDVENMVYGMFSGENEIVSSWRPCATGIIWALRERSLT